MQNIMETLAITGAVWWSFGGLCVAVLGIIGKVKKCKPIEEVGIDLCMFFIRLGFIFFILMFLVKFVGKYCI